jgi:hypothetical protein
MCIFFSLSFSSSEMPLPRPHPAALGQRVSQRLIVLR